MRPVLAFLAGYLSVGVVVIATGYLSHRRAKKDAPERVGVRLAAANLRKNKTLQHMVVENVVLPLVMIAVWPVAIVHKIQEVFASKRQAARPEKPEFAVTRSDLQEQLTVREVVQREFVTDPLGAVPNLPFGHLHTAWSSLLASRNADAAIWSFSARWTSDWGRKELRSGYVLVCGDVIGPHMLTEWKFIDDE